jgi:non-specific serine/threonine protein kinase
LVAGAEQGLRGSEQAAWFEQLEREHDNLRAGLSRVSDPDMQLQLATALFYFWSRRGYLSEGRRWLTLALGNAQSLHPAPMHAKALYSAAQLAYLQGASDAAHSLAVQSIAVSKQVGDTRSYAYALTFLGLAAAQQGDIGTARSVGTESVALFREVGDTWGLAMALNCLVHTTREAGDHDLARPLAEESMALFRMAGDQWGVALVLLGVGSLELLRQNYRAARAAFEASLTIFQQFGDMWGVNAALHSLGEVALKQRDYTTARAQLQAVLSSRSDLGDRRGIAEALGGLAAVARAQGQLRTAAALGGAAEALVESIGARMPSYAQTNDKDNLADLSNAMGESQFATIWAEGRAMTVEQAIQYALALPMMTESTAVQDDDPNVVQQTVHPHLEELTPREREVAALIAQGKSNRAIAQALVISEKTAERHVANILSKLGFHSRTQIAAWAVEKGASSMPG